MVIFSWYLRAGRLRKGPSSRHMGPNIFILSVRTMDGMARSWVRHCSDLQYTTARKTYTTYTTYFTSYSLERKKLKKLEEAAYLGGYRPKDNHNF